MLARLSAHRDEIERDDIDPSGFDGRKIIGEAQILAASLLDRLTRKCEPQPFGLLVVLVNDQIVAAGLAREIAVNELCLEQLFADRLGFDLGEFRINRLVQNLLIFFGGFPSLLVLPLALEESGLVDEGKTFVRSLISTTFEP